VNRLFLDSNVLFTAAHNENGEAALVIGLAAAGRWRVASSEHAIEEARRNLSRKYPQALERLGVILGPVRQVRQAARLDVGDGGDQPVARSRAQLLPKDQLILDAAAGCRATHLLTGDVRHFGPLMNRPEITGDW
jgi:uncharacterized protein